MAPPSTILPRIPIGLALVLARSVSFAPETGQLTIVGPYSEVLSESFPATYLSLETYAVLTACDGDVLVEFRLVDSVGTRPPIFRHLLSARFDGPLAVQELVFHTYNVTIPEEGVFLLQLFVHGPSGMGQESLVLERRLNFTLFL